jgi:type I restriction enzyme M protein
MTPIELRVSERRTEHLLAEILQAQGWDLRRPPQGELLRQQEYKNYPSLLDLFASASKTGRGAGLPEAVLVDRESLTPLAVIEAKADVVNLPQAVKEAQGYSNPCVSAGHTPLAIGIAGTSEDEFGVQVQKWNGSKWIPVTYDGNPINWIPNRTDLDLVAPANRSSELRPTIPPPEVLAQRADEINRLLRESGIMDQMRPSIVGAIMLGLWHSRGKIRKDPEYILGDINESCKKAFWAAHKAELSASIRVDEANRTLAVKARRILTILERLNVTVLTAEYDYLGQLYETFFRYTGGNTIGQYFTPRHIASLMADFVEVERNDIVLDPACGTGGFLIAAMNRIMVQGHLSRTQMVKVVQSRLIGFDQEPQTAALCVANMILRGDGSTGVKRGDCFTSPKYPIGKASVVLMNPPFPHEKTDTPPEKFVDRALEGLQHRGRLAVIVPMQLLVKRDKQRWRAKLLAKNTLDAIVTLPDELFLPYAQPYTNVLVVTKGVPHDFKKPIFFARIGNDGFRLHKNVRAPRAGSQLPDVLKAYRSAETILGLCGPHLLKADGEWRPGAYIPARPLSPEEVLEEVGILIRSKTALVVKYAPQFRRLRESLRKGRLEPRDFHEYINGRTYDAIKGGVIGTYFEIFYGQKELEAKEGLGEGETPVISSSGEDNGCHGFYDFDWLIKPAIVTVPRTGSIGKAHVQEWPVGASSDNLLLLPRPGVSPEQLYVASAVIRRERWRFNYGSKITPSRIAHFPLPSYAGVSEVIRQQLREAARIEFEALREGGLENEVPISLSKEEALWRAEALGNEEAHDSKEQPSKPSSMAAARVIDSVLNARVKESAILRDSEEDF